MKAEVNIHAPKMTGKRDGKGVTRCSATAATSPGVTPAARNAWR